MKKTKRVVLFKMREPGVAAKAALVTFNSIEAAQRAFGFAIAKQLIEGSAK